MAGKQGEVVKIRVHAPRRIKQGHWLCRWCGKRCPGKKRSWCCKECYEEGMLRLDNAHLRRKVFDRDKGACALCGIDTEALAERVRRLYHKIKDWRRFEKRLKALTGLRVHDYIGHQPWEADHIVEQSAGGDSNMENLQTLCLACHRKKTAEMHRRNAMLRKEVPPKYLEKAAGNWDLPLFSGVGQRV